MIYHIRILTEWYDDCDGREHLMKILTFKSPNFTFTEDVEILNPEMLNCNGADLGEGELEFIVGVRSELGEYGVITAIADQLRQDGIRIKSIDNNTPWSADHDEPF